MADRDQTTSSFLVFPLLLLLWLGLCCCRLSPIAFPYLILDILPHWRRSRRSRDTKFVSRVSDFPVKPRTESTAQPARVRTSWTRDWLCFSFRLAGAIRRKQCRRAKAATIGGIAGRSGWMDDARMQPLPPTTACIVIGAPIQRFGKRDICRFRSC